MNAILDSRYAKSTPLNVTEMSLIGALLDPTRSLLHEVQTAGLTYSHFADLKCAATFRHIEEMHEQGQSVDSLTVAQSISEDPDFDIRGVDYAFLSECFTSNTNFGLVHVYVEIIKAQSMKREVRNAGMEMIQAADNDMDADDLVEFAQKAVENLAQGTTADLPADGSQLAQAVLAMRNPVRGALTPWADLNTRIGGLMPGRMYVVGARPGVGKSVVSLQLAMGLARHGYVSFTSLEMGSNEIFNRMMAHDLKIDLTKIEKGLLSDDEWDKVDGYVAQNPRRGLIVNDDSQATLASIKKHARAAARRGKLTGIVVDYIGLVAAPAGTSANTPRHTIIAELSRGLKNLSRELNVPVIAVSQLNRDSAGGGEDRMPGIHHLRESGAVEQDADVILLLHRDLLDEKGKTELKLLVAKNRQGTTGGIHLDFAGHICTARTVDRQHAQAMNA